LRNNISYIQFKNQLLPLGVFSLCDVRKVYPRFDSRRFTEWQQQGYLVKIIKGWYRFAEVSVDELLLFRISNAIRKPSYISLQSALSYHGIIPEQSFAITAVTSLKTQQYQTADALFTYRSISPALLFGYHVQRHNNAPVLLADAEKAVLDYLYLHAALTQTDDFEALRWNTSSLRELNPGKLEQYLNAMHNKALHTRFEILKKYMT
jgi:predicted transcriptional regulator of viral defense system